MGGLTVKNQRKNYGHKLAELLDIPLETIDWPKVTLNGNTNAVIQNHRGVIEYDQNIVRINTKLGEIKVTGEKLTLVAASKEEIIVEGLISGAQMVDWR